MIQIPPLGPGNEVMPMMAPDVRYAFCRFDLAQGPVRLKGSVPNDLWMIAFYTPEGDNFYTVPGADMKSAQIDLVIATGDQTVAEAGVDAPEGADELFVIKSPVHRRCRHRSALHSRGRAVRRAPKMRSRPRLQSAEEVKRATLEG